MYTNPSGGEVRNDSVGQGYWNAPRGSRLHLGVDLLLPRGIGQAIVSPHEGFVERRSFPYGSNEIYSGVYIKGTSVESKLWYLEPIPLLIGRNVRQGQVIGYAQDISLKYKDADGNPCDPHIHWQIGKYGEIDPLILI